MKTLFYRLFIFLIPLFLFTLVSVGSFYYYDPFFVLKDYEEFPESVVDYNEEYVATERYLKNPNQFNAFIFGSSRAACGFRLNDWSSSLRENVDSLFLFAASNETIFGILGKIKLIDEVGGPFQHALIILDSDKTFKSYENSKGHIFVKHYRVSHSSQSTFTTTFLKDYIFSGFFIRYLDYKIFHTQRSYMNGYLNLLKEDIERPHELFDLGIRDLMIAKDSIQYYKDKATLFYKRPKEVVTNKPMISERGVAYLKEIKAIFDKHQTDYKLVIAPLYDQHKMNSKDIQILQSIFGDYVYDYTGKSDLTNDFHNYFELSHFRPHIGAQIMRDIYNYKDVAPMVLWTN